MLSHSSPSVTCTDAKVIHLLTLFPSMSHNDICTLIESFMSERDVKLENIDDGELVAFVTDFVHPQVNCFSFLAQCKCQQELFQKQQEEREEEIKRHEYIQRLWENSKKSSCKKKACLPEEQQYETEKQGHEKENGSITINKTSGEKIDAIDNCNVVVETKECSDETCQREETLADDNDNCPPILSFGAKHTNASTHNVQNFLSSVMLNEFTNTLFGSANFAALSHLREFNNTIEFFSIDTSEWDQMYLHTNTPSPSLCNQRNMMCQKQRDANYTKRSNMYFTTTLSEDIYLPLYGEDEEHELVLVEDAEDSSDNVERVENQQYTQDQRVPIIKWAPAPITTTTTPNNTSDNISNGGSENSSRICTEDNNNNNNNISANNKNEVANKSCKATEIIVKGANGNIEKDVNTNTNIKILKRDIANNINSSNIVTELVLPKTHYTTENTQTYLISVRAHDNVRDSNNVQSTSTTTTTGATTRRGIIQLSSEELSPPIEISLTPAVQQNTLPPSVQFAQLIGMGSSPSTNNVESSSSTAAENDDDDEDKELAQDENFKINEFINTSARKTKTTIRTTTTKRSKAQHRSSSQYPRTTEAESRRSVSRLSAAFPLCEWIINPNSPNVEDDKLGRMAHGYDEKSYQQWSVQRSRWREVQQQQKRVWEHEQQQQQQQQQRSKRYIRRAQSEQVRRSHSLNKESRHAEVNSCTCNNYGDRHNKHIQEPNKLTCSNEQSEQRRSQAATSSRVFYSMQHYRAHSAEPTYMSKLWSEIDKSHELTIESSNSNIITNSLITNNEHDICDGNENNDKSNAHINITQNKELKDANIDDNINRNVICPQNVNEPTLATNAATKMDEENKEIYVANIIKFNNDDDADKEHNSDDENSKDNDDISSENKQCSFDVLEFLETEERRAHCMMNTLSTKGAEFDHRGKCHLVQLIVNKCPAMVDVLQCHLPELFELFAELLKGTELLSAKDEIAVQIPVIGSRKLLAHGSLILSSVEFDTLTSSVTLLKESEYINKNKSSSKKKLKRKMNKGQAKHTNDNVVNVNTTSQKVKNNNEKTHNVEENKDDDGNTCFALDIMITKLKTLPMSFAFIDEKDAYHQSHSTPEQAERLRAALLSSSILATTKTTTTTTITALSSTTQEKLKKADSRSKHKQKITREMSDTDNFKSSCKIDDDDANAFLYYDHGVTSGNLSITAHKIHITACASLTLSLTRVMALNISNVHLHMSKIDINTSVRKLNILCTLLKPIIKRILIRKLTALLQSTHYL